MKTIRAHGADPARKALPLMVLLALAACAGRSEEALQQARLAVDGVRNDPAVETNAPVRVDQAESALQQAEAAWTESQPGAEVDHRAYLAQQRAAIARAAAAERVAQNEIEQLGQEREGVVLGARERQVETLEQQLAELQAEETQRGMVITLGDILFDVDGTDLKPGGIQQLTRLADALRTDPDRNVVVEGHTDSTGSEAYNRDLSQRRAFAVEDFLISQGVDPRRIISRGYGQQYPVATNETSAGRQQNRRVEIVVLDEGETDSPRG